MKKFARPLLGLTLAFAVTACGQKTPETPAAENTSEAAIAAEDNATTAQENAGDDSSNSQAGDTATSQENVDDSSNSQDGGTVHADSSDAAPSKKDTNQLIVVNDAPASERSNLFVNTADDPSGSGSSSINITPTSIEDYSNVMYETYRSSLGSEHFSFQYPVNLYKTVSHDYDINEKSGYGERIEYVLFRGGEGSSLEYTMFRRTDNMSTQQLLDKIHDEEVSQLLIKQGNVPDIIPPDIFNGYGFTVVTGWTDSTSKIVYEVIDVESDYVLTMRIISRSSDMANAVTQQLYDGCGFNKKALTN